MLHTLSDAIGSQVPLYGAGTDGAGGSGPGTDIYEAAIVVGNALAGDTAQVCNYLDPGDGTGIAAAFAAAAALAPQRVDIYLRRGTYTSATVLVPPAGSHVRGAGIGATIVAGPQADATHDTAGLTVTALGF